MTIHERLKIIKAGIDAALKRSKWGLRSVTILGAAKGQSLNAIRSAAELGIVDIGENYAQDLISKAPLSLDTDIRWHFIGKLQSNKVKHLVPYVASIQSVDSLELADRITRVREQMETPRSPVPILIQVNVGSERQKAGLPPNVIESLFPQFLEMSGIRVVGLMSIPPQVKDPEKARPYFQSMKSLFDKLKTQHREPGIFQVLSMGMSADYGIAVEEGATCVRIGEALFGPRPKPDREE